MKKIANKSVIILCLLVMASPALQAQKQEPIPTIDRIVQKVLGQIYDANGKPRGRISVKKVRNTLSEIVDWDILVRRSLGANWNKLSKKEQKEVVDLTSQLIVRTYTAQLNGTARPVVTYGKVRKQGAGRLFVDTKIKVGRQKFKGDYRFINAGGKWKCYDFLVEGASVVSGYRTQFNSHFKKGNGAQLIQQLNSQL